jgi:NAD(P)-dependent dehydrogenase (short-subunit alcohol dehydrogenase family)
MNMTAAPVMLVAGGSGSVGQEIAAQAAMAGWRVALHGRRTETVDASSKAVLARQPHAELSVHVADFAAVSAIVELVAQAVAAHARLDAVVDCTTGGPAGIAGPFAATDPEAYALFAAHSAIAFQRLAHAALPALCATHGSLIALVSDAGRFAAPLQTLIGSMRAATIGFVRNLAVEAARDGLRVNAVSLSYVENTAIVRRLADASAARMESARRRAGLGLPSPADVARLVLFLAGAGAAKITGQVISINGGLSA